MVGLGGTITCRGLGSGCVEGMNIKFEVYNLAQVTFGIEGYIHDPQGG